MHEGRSWICWAIATTLLIALLIFGGLLLVGVVGSIGIAASDYCGILKAGATPLLPGGLQPFRGILQLMNVGQPVESRLGLLELALLLLIILVVSSGVFVARLPHTNLQSIVKYDVGRHSAIFATIFALTAIAKSFQNIARGGWSEGMLRMRAGALENYWDTASLLDHIRYVLAYPLLQTGNIYTSAGVALCVGVGTFLVWMLLMHAIDKVVRK